MTRKEGWRDVGSGGVHWAAVLLANVAESLPSIDEDGPIRAVLDGQQDWHPPKCLD